MAVFAQANGVTIHHADDGPRDGPPVVFANALGTDLRIWDNVLPLLPAHRLIRHDQRGHGLSQTGARPYSMALLADDLAALMETLRTGPATVVGLSVGGLVAQALASRRPDLVARLVLVGTAAKIGTAEMWSERVAIVRANGIAPLVEPTMERWFTPSFRLTGNPDYEGYRMMLARAAPDGYCATAEAIGRTDLTTRSSSLA
ncbi:MAG: alpha/beta fold hydrolase, partial [Rhizobiaceae bacterium]